MKKQAQMHPHTAHKQRNPMQSPTGLGTFAGVFTPSILTILGIILFLRLGYVVGNAGLGRTLIIIGLANAISVLTTFSLAAVATNLKVKGGGDYYLISRTLGIEFGGAIGIVLYLAQSVSIAFYCIGFGEALSAMLPWSEARLPQIIAALSVAFLFVFAWLGTDWATRFQYVVMAVLGLALVSFFVGGWMRWNPVTLAQNWSAPPAAPGFWILFAIFFPAVTGFTQGVSMSGDLKDAGHSLPLGTFCAVGLSIVIYFGAALVFSAAQPGSLLSSNYNVMQKTAWFGSLISAGVIAATLSSAMASFLGAPRILQRLAGDRIFPFLLPFAKGFGPAQNPRRGILLSAGIAVATIAMGNLNLIAPVVSMFFLISYGLLNYATYFEARSASPSFRPRFRWFDARLSLLGWLACLGAMLAIDLTAGIVAIAVLFAIYQYLKRTAGPARWADSRRSYHLQRVRESLLAAAAEPEHSRDWRPQILALSNDPPRRGHLLRFASWLEGGSGFTTVAKILEGEGLQMLKRKSEAEEELHRELATHSGKAFPLVIIATSVYDGIHSLVQGSGIGPLKVNTVILNWFDPFPKGLLEQKERQMGRNLRAAFRFGSNIVILKGDDEAWRAMEALEAEKRRIDVWWQDNPTGGLMLLLAYLTTRNETWHEAQIRIFAAANADGPELTVESLQTMLQEARIEADPHIVTPPDVKDIITRSADAALVFIPFRFHYHQLLGPSDIPLDELLPHLPFAAAILAAEDIDLDAEPEEGKAGEMAAVMDALTDAEKKVRRSEKNAARTAEEAAEKVEALETALDSRADTDLQKKVNAVVAAKKQAENAARKVAKAQAKVEDAAKTAEALGLGPVGKNTEKQEPE